jgi:PAS domain S-box-containing protein
LADAISNAVAGGVGRFHAFCPTRKGTPKWWDIVITPITDAEGKVVRLLASSRDVTDRKEVELEQKRNGERFRALADSMPQMVWTARPDGYVDYYNQRWLDYTGLSLEETEGDGWKQTHHPDDVQGSVDKWAAAVETGKVYENEMRFLRAKDRTYRWHFTRSMPVRSSGKITRWVGTCTDIQDRKAAEEMLRETQAQIEANVRERLESRVAERTAELRHEIRERLKAERELQELSGELLTAKDSEQRRIARDLHDSVGQLLTAATITLSAVLGETDRLSPNAGKALSEAAQLLQETSREVRVVSHLLHPPLLDEIGLHSALSFYMDGFRERGGIQTELKIEEDFGRLPIPMETAIFRVIQECLTNIHRHSGSPTAKVTVSRSSDEIRVEVADRGHGIPEQKAYGVGLRGMRERIKQLSGVLEIRSSAAGTAIVARIPVPQALSPQTPA